MSTPCFPFASLRSTVLCSSFATLCLSSLFYSLLCLAFASLRTAYLCCAFAVLYSAMPFLSMLCLCKSGQCHAFPCLCSAGQRNAVPSHVCSKLSLCHAQHFTAELFLRCSLQREAAQCVASPFRCFSLLGCPSHCLTLLFLCHATPRLCSSMPCISLAVPSYAMPLPGNALRCCPAACQSTSLLGLALPSPCFAVHSFALARLFRRLPPRGSGLCRSCATGPDPGSNRSPATLEPGPGPPRSCRRQ